MQINFNLKNIFKWVVVLAALVFVGYSLGEVTYQNAVVMLITLFVVSKA